MPGHYQRATTAWNATTASSASSSLQQLPLLCWQRIIQLHLDPFSRSQLRRVSQLFHHLVSSTQATSMAQLSIPVSHLPRAADSDDLFAAESPSCLCITAARRPVALSLMNQRRRAEQQMLVFLDNTNQPWPRLTALDISTALSHIACTTLQALVESLPRLHQLSLPPVATCGGSEADALFALQQLRELCACDLDCRYFSASSSSSSTSASSATSSSLQDSGRRVEQQQHVELLQDMQPLLYHQQQHQQLCSAHSSIGHHQQQQQQDDDDDVDSHPAVAWSQHLQIDDACAAAASTHASTSTAIAGERRKVSRPWSGLGGLTHVAHLQLQHLQAGCLRDCISAVSHMPALRSLSITGLCRAAAAVLLTPLANSSTLAPAAGGSAQDDFALQPQWLLESLQDVAGLTRLELGLDPSPSAHNSPGAAANSSSSSVSSPASSLVVPAHLGNAANQPHAAADTASVTPLSCAWSCLQQVQELVLHGVCIDSPLYAATLDCQRLTALHVGGLDLQQDVRAVAGFGDVLGLNSLRVLHVEQHFNLGVNSAAALMPELRHLKLTHAGSCSPSLKCLEHHRHLSSLDISAAAAPGSGGNSTSSTWSLHTLQLGYLVHLTVLQALRLAEASSSCCNEDRAGVRPVRSGSGSQLPGSRFGSGIPGCSKSSSHWLPACTGHLTQVTSLELSGPVTDHALGQLPGQFPGLKRLTVDSSYFASDGGLQKLNCSPKLELLVLRNCRHITDFGLEVLLMAGGIRVVAVQGCAGIDERACHRIRKACRYAGSQLLFYGEVGSNAAASSMSTGSSISGAGSSSPGGSVFLQRCWQQEQLQLGGVNGESSALASQQVWEEAGPTAALVAAATGVWLGSSSSASAPPVAGSVPTGASGSSSESSCSRFSGVVWEGSKVRPGPAATSPHSSSVPVVGVPVVAGSSSSACPRPRRISGGCLPPAGVHGVRGVDWKKTAWGGGPGQAFAH